MKKALFAFTLITSSASAANWVPIGVDTTGTRYYLDTATMVQDQSGWKVWVKQYPGKPQRYVYAIGQEFDNCSKRTRQLLNVTQYGENGDVLNSYDFSGIGSPDPVVPDSIGEHMLNVVCATLTVSPRKRPPRQSTKHRARYYS